MITLSEAIEKGMAINVSTQTEAKALLAEFRKRKLKWKDHTSYVSTYFRDYREDTCYCPREGNYDYKQRYEELERPGFKIVKFSEMDLTK